MVSLEELAVTFPGGIQALNGVTVDIKAGNFVSIVGPSGCGKSTLLRVVAGLVSPTLGTISVAGETSQDHFRKAARPSFVFQDPTLLPWRNVFSNVSLPLELRSDLASPDSGKLQVKERRAKVLEMIDLVGLTKFSKAYPRHLSGGMKMRASLARALIADPKLLLMDEPFGAIDALTRQSLNEELLKLWQTTRPTLLFVTHNVAEAVFLSQRVLVLSSRPGRIVADIHVPYDYPRSFALTATPSFVAILQQIQSKLESSAK